MPRIDLNCDMGEGIGNEEALMPCITSANIACGGHAGDERIMRETVVLAARYGVAVGAHPGFADREHFGRRELLLPPDTLYRTVLEQIARLKQIAEREGVRLQHVKPHGALYNLAARDVDTANLIARAVAAVDPALVLFGLSGSHSVAAAERLGLATASEVFADRTYCDDGSLTPRSQPGALIEDPAKAVAQVLQMVRQGTVTTLTGRQVPIRAETICLHGDGPHALTFARAISSALKEQ